MIKKRKKHIQQKTKKEKLKYVVDFKDVFLKDVPLVGGKNASLGEMINVLEPKGINVPGGFALTSHAYWYFLQENKIDVKLEKIFTNFKGQDIKSVQRVGKKARALFLHAKFPSDLEDEVFKAYYFLRKRYGLNTSVAVRTSGVAEDAPGASFAGQFETFLNVKNKKDLLMSIKLCMASTFNDRAITYRKEKKISQLDFALSVGVQKMVRSDIACSGVMFTIDTETGFKNVVSINSIWGIGEMIVKGWVTPDDFYVFKPTLKQGFKSIIVKNLGRKTHKLVYGERSGLKKVEVPKNKQTMFSLTDKEVLTLAKWGMMIEEHYKLPQDIEWAKDGKTGKLFIVQSRPETVHSVKKENSYSEYIIKTKKQPILTGIAVGDKIGYGKVNVINDVSKISKFSRGEVLVTKMTDPDWVTAFPLASAIITQEGGPTCHAAIVSRELGVPCIVGVKDVLKTLKSGKMVTADCTQGRMGRIFAGEVSYRVKKYDLTKKSKLKTKIMLNIAAPEIAFQTSFLPVDGVGLAREEFIIAEKIKVHPLALYHYEKLKKQSYRGRTKKAKKLKQIIKKIDKITIEHADKREYFVKELAEGIGQIAAAFYPKEVIVRFSDFKTNEYRNLVGGELFEKQEANPMIGFRGAYRYLDKGFQPAFKMECQAIQRVRNDFGLKNVSVMVPFCRTIKEGKDVLELMKKFGLNSYQTSVKAKKQKHGLNVYVMCEVPSNVILAEQFLEIFDGMSIGSNDLTQLVLGVDRDEPRVAPIFDERNEAVKEMIKKVIKLCRQKKKYSGICGQAPSDFPDFAQFLLEEKIGSISLSFDAVIKTIIDLSAKK